MSKQARSFLRFGIDQRIEHVVLLLSFFILALTGIPQKFPLAPISETIVRLLGGIETIRIIHRVSATVMMLSTLYHILSTAYRMFVLRLKPGMLPKTRDVFDAIDSLLYNLGIKKERPKMERFNFMEKAEYWALVWGTVIMGLTGFMLWNPIITARILPGEIIPAAKAAHSAEALLAVLAIILWHFYHVHIKEWNWSMFTGRLDRHQMEAEHAAELEAIESGQVPEPVSPELRKQRQRVFLPAAALFSVVFLGLVYFFTSYEQTAIVTLPTDQWVVTPFSPVTKTPSPTFTPAPTLAQAATQAETQTGDLTWDGTVSALFQTRCVACHGSLGGFSVESLEAVIAGGENGPGIIAGDPDASMVIIIQEAGGHVGQFTPEEIEQVRSWIAAGAP